MDSQLLCQNIDEEGSWTVSMKLHRNDANFSEALQQEKEAQREAMMLVSQSLSPSPKKKLKISVKSNEEEKESQDEESAGGKSPKKQSTELVLTPRQLKRTLTSVLKRESFRRLESNLENTIKTEDASPLKKKEEVISNPTFNKSEGFQARILILILIIRDVSENIRNWI